MSELPLIILVVATRMSRFSFLWERKRSAEISVKVQPPTNTTRVTLDDFAFVLS